MSMYAGFIARSKSEEEKQFYKKIDEIDELTRDCGMDYDELSYEILNVCDNEVDCEIIPEHASEYERKGERMSQNKEQFLDELEELVQGLNKLIRLISEY